MPWICVNNGTTLCVIDTDRVSDFIAINRGVDEDAFNSGFRTRIEWENGSIWDVTDDIESIGTRLGAV